MLRVIPAAEILGFSVGPLLIYGKGKPNMQRCPSCGFQFEGSPAESAEPGYTPAGAAESNDAGAPVTAGPIERLEKLEKQMDYLTRAVEALRIDPATIAPAAEQPAPAEAPPQ